MVHLKSNRELELLRASADLVGRTLGVVASAVGVGVTTAELNVLAETFIQDYGATPAFKGYQVGLEVFPATLCTSVNDHVVHGIPNNVPLQDGDVLSVDCGVLLNDYYGDSAYTFAIGDISDDSRQLLTTTYESLLLGIEQATSGKRLGDIGAAIQAHCEAMGYGVVKDLVGHGIGRNLHEDPQVPNFGRPGSGRKLKTGLTICIEPMINRGTASVRTEGDGWTVMTADSLMSAHYEHTVVVRSGEAEVLTTFNYIEEALAELPYKLNADVAHG